MSRQIESMEMCLMLNDRTFLAIIPARGGSKRLPRKNVLDLAGKPLISWTIDAAKNATYIDHIVVTSDDSEILEVAKDRNVATIVRPAQLSTDTATTFDTVKHAIENVTLEYDYVVLLQPTSPLRTEEHINEAIELLFEKEADAIISVCKTEHSPLWSNTLPESESLEGFISDEIKNKRGQDLPDYFRLNGAVYICKKNRFFLEKTFFLKSKVFSYIMTNQSSIDIDTSLDFKFVTFIMSSRIAK